jgi:hypothetical protein
MSHDWPWVRSGPYGGRRRWARLKTTVEDSLRPLVADSRLRWSEIATDEEVYEIADQEPHLLLLQSLE